jgi:hypothetical protein
MASTHSILIALSSKRLALLESDPETLEDVVEARTRSPGSSISARSGSPWT